MMNAVLTAGNAAAVVFESINCGAQSRRIGPAALQWANNHNPTDTPGAGSSGDGGHSRSLSTNAGSAPHAKAAPPTKAAPPLSPAEIRRLDIARRAAKAPYPHSPVIGERARRHLAPKRCACHAEPEATRRTGSYPAAEQQAPAAEAVAQLGIGTGTVAPVASVTSVTRVRQEMT